MKKQHIIFIAAGVLVIGGIIYFATRPAPAPATTPGVQPLIVTGFSNGVATGTWAGNTINTSSNNTYTSSDGNYQLTNNGNTFTVAPAGSTNTLVSGTINGTGTIVLAGS